MPADGGVSVAAQGFDQPSNVRQVLLNVLSLLGAYAVPRAFTFAAAVVAARVLGVATFGIYGSAGALAIILSILATLGMMQLLVREVARAPERAPELVAGAHVAKAVSLVVMLLALAAAAGALDYTGPAFRAAMLLGLAYGIGAYAENLGGYFQGVERMGIWLEAQALYGVVFGGLGILLVVITRDLVWFCTAPVAGQLTAVAWLLRRAPTDVRRAWRAPWPVIASLLGALAPFALGILFLTAYRKTDILLLEQWRGGAEAGLYAAAYRFVDLAHALSLVVATALYPRLSRLVAPGTPRESVGRRAAGRATELLLLAGVPAASLLWLLRDPVITLLFGGSYGRAAPVLGLLAPALPFLAVNALGTVILAASQRMRVVAGLYFSALVLNVGLNTFLIPARGAEGAGLSMLISEAALGCAMLIAVHSFTAAAPRLRPLAVAAAIGLLAPLLAAAEFAGSLTAAAVYAGVVGAAYAVVGVVSPAERALLRGALRR